MRIGTWNLEGKGTPGHLALLREQACDVWLLREVPDGLSVPSLTEVATTGPMLPGKRWAAVHAARGAQVASPHPASAVAEIDGRTFVSSVLPWRGSGGAPPWAGTDHAARTTAVLADLRPVLVGPLVWGGDWNHALTGKEYAGSAAGRAAVQDLVDQLGLIVATAELPHRTPDQFSIDHVAVPVPARSAVRVDAGGLSDHDAYVVEVDLV